MPTHYIRQLASNGQTLPGILTWQFNHELPYKNGITEDIYHDLFVNGYHSEHNLAGLFITGFDFITLVKANLKWVRAEVDTRASEFESITSVCPFDTSTRYITVTLMRDYVKVRKYANHKVGQKKGDEEIFRRRTYLHLYLNPVRRAEQNNAFEEDLIALRSQVEEGASVGGLSISAQILPSHRTAKKTLSSVCGSTARENGLNHSLSR